MNRYFQPIWCAPHRLWCIVMGGVVVVSTACEREARRPRVAPPYAQRIDPVVMSELRAGGVEPAIFEEDLAPIVPAPEQVKNQYEQNAYAVNEGKRLFADFNCVGCHANGGGGMGPALMDDVWIYGSRPEQVFATIVEGRPDGMPSFYGRLTDHQVWQLVAYVRTLGGLVEADTAPGRADHMPARPPEHSLPQQDP